MKPVKSNNTPEQNRLRLKALENVELDDGADDPNSSRMGPRQVGSAPLPKGKIGTSMNGKL